MNTGPYDALFERAADWPAGDLWPRLIRFFAGTLESLSSELPRVARTALRVAVEFTDGAAPAGALEQQRIAVWHYLEGHQVEAVTMRLTRAALCALYPAPSYGGALESLDYFVEMVDPTAQLVPMVMAHFDQFFSRDSS